jgi:prevent-host-death family protein
MASETVNVHDAKSGLSRLLARVERGDRITIARAGRPVARLVPIQNTGSKKLPPEDPLLNLGDFAVDGPGGDFSNADIDRALYGRK